MKTVKFVKIIRWETVFVLSILHDSTPPFCPTLISFNSLFSLIVHTFRHFLDMYSPQVVGAAHSAVKGLKMTEAETAKGKTCVKAAIHMASESRGW